MADDLHSILARIRKQEADTYLHTGRFEQARARYEEACRLDPTDPRAWVMLGNLHGRLGAADQAEAAYRRAIERDPGRGEAHQFLGNLLTRQGRYAEAMDCYRRALQIKPQSVPAHVNLAAALAETGELEEAIAVLEALLEGNASPMNDEERTSARARLEALYAARADRQGDAAAAGAQDSAHAHEAAEEYKREARLLLENADPAGAYAMLTRAHELVHDDAQVPALLGLAAARLGDHEAAERHLREALTLDPDNDQTLNDLAAALTSLNRLDEAVACYEQALERTPTAFTHYCLGNIHMGRQRLEEAESHFRLALALEPNRPEIYNNLGCALRHQGLFEQAEAAFREALRLAPHHPNAYEGYTNLGTVLLITNRLEEAGACFERAFTLKPGCQRAIAGQANVLQKQGDREQAYTLLEPLLSSGEADTNAALVLAAICRPLQRCAEAIALAERLLAGEGAPADLYEWIMLHFILGGLFDERGDYDRAFHYFERGNAAAARRFDAEAHRRDIDALVQTYTPSLMASAPRAGHRSERPVFIVGMPRSGTSLVEQILASHPQVFGAGELEHLHKLTLDIPIAGGDTYPECMTSLPPERFDELARRYLDRLDELAPAGALRVTDKMPGNFLHLGLIGQLFPHARIIHCVRDPLDTCLSCYFHNFVALSYSYDLADLGFYYREYQRLMDHWRQVLDMPMMEVRYEDLVADQEGMSRALVEFCGLDWHERCLRFHETRRVVATASYDQVRRPMYNRSVERWRHYEHHLEPLRRALAEHQHQA